ncbi:helix-turn-helix transcriptional regulator [Streptomyces asoensis]|uniref:Helix-turn-helix transcriptional regulator n=1 Tax=Streptomyces asoensis TaxID=249586 RepID=A0A6M4WNV7_9ACTN|nr:helix-turn-helix transcriptional regulator [Streptomyces asoensis]QJT01798.1 helix-turn-helix transcriptional regulator [Streptomyces asoensis]
MPSASPPPDWVLTQRRAIGERIRAERLHAGLTQEQISIRSGVDRASVVRIEQGQQSPTVDTLIRLAVAIGVPLVAFVQ